MVADKCHTLSQVDDACRSCEERIPAVAGLFACHLQHAKETESWMVVVVVTWSYSMRRLLGFLWKGSRCKAVCGPTSCSRALGHCGFPLKPLIFAASPKSLVVGEHWVL